MREERADVVIVGSGAGGGTVAQRLVPLVAAGRRVIVLERGARVSAGEMTGDELTEALLALRPDLPVIICTGFSERINREKAMAMGVEGFLMKPIVKSELARAIRKVLDHAGTRRGSERAAKS